MRLPNSLASYGTASVQFLLVVTLVGRFVVTSSSVSCSPDECVAPDCFCAGLTPPGDLPVDQIPQMVVLTFDDAVLPEFELEVYERIFNRGSSSPTSDTADAGEHRRSSVRPRTNPNGCPIGTTFYASHNGTDYDLVRRLHSAGHEMASHSVTHRLPQSYWASASYDKWHREIVGQRENLVKLARLNDDTVEGQSSSRRRSDPIVVGVRAPFLETGGDEQFRMMVDERFVYDSSMMTGPHQAGAVWPFTLDFAPSVEFCSNNRCPKRSAPGIWELPLNRWVGRDGRPCAMVDSCDVQPISKGDALSYFWHNFGRFYRGNRAPFGIHLHPDWLLQNPDYFAAFETFIDSLLTDMRDVYFVTASQVISWMKDPQTVDKAPYFGPWMASCIRNVGNIGRNNIPSVNVGTSPRQLPAPSVSSERPTSVEKDYERYQLEENAQQREGRSPDSGPNTSPIEPMLLRNNTTLSDHTGVAPFSSADEQAAETFSTESDTRGGERIDTRNGERFDTVRSDNKPLKHITTNGSFPRANDAVQEDAGAEREPLSASRRRKGGPQGSALGNYGDEAPVAVYEEPIGQLAEQAPSTGQHEEKITNFAAEKTSDSTSTITAPHNRRAYDFTRVAHPADNRQHAAIGESIFTTEKTTIRSMLSATDVNELIAFYQPVEEHVAINAIAATDNGLWNGHLRRAGDNGQLKSGPADDNAWEEMILRVDPLSPTVPTSFVSSGSAADWVPSAASVPTVASSVGKATNDNGANLPAAVMSAAAHVTSSSCVAVCTAKWAATALITLLTLAVSHQ